MIIILFILFLLSLTLFLYKEREGLDNCPPIEGTTSSGLTNTANLASIKKKIDNVNILKQQIDKNTSDIKTKSEEMKEVLDLKQKVADLSKETKKMQQNLANFGGAMQAKGFTVANTTKKDMPNPLPQLHSDPYAGNLRTK